MRMFPFAAAVVLAGLSVAPARAAHLELQGGRSYMDAHGTNVGFIEAVFAPRAIAASRFSWTPDVSLGWIDRRDLARYRQDAYPSDRSVALLAAGARLHYGEAGDWYRPLFFSFQLAGANRTTQALSSHYQFVSTLGWQWRHVSVQVRHISNGGLDGRNRGETMALVGIGLNL